MKLVVALLLCCACISSGWAEQKISRSGYDVHYIVLPSTDLSAEIASRYGIPRSQQLAYANISVLDADGQPVAMPVEAQVTLLVKNLLGQVRTFRLQQVMDGNAIYHWATFSFDDEETLRFEVQVERPDASFSIEFSQPIYRSL